ncbi:MAG: DUF1385 domain-containing protein [Dehalococcoidia bacterium]|nr:DUF1385 domain-containing protein [Dehalococcoidia bacterium]MDW8119390.1 DUF1385 domain-containing protein [Chloroflexota bacterium]
MSQPFAYGGQALIEGVMIRGQRWVALAVRRPDGSLATQVWPLASLFQGRWRRYPLVRGPVVLAETLVVGLRALSYSAQVASGEEECPSAPAMWGAVLLALVIAVGIFLLVPLVGGKALIGAGLPVVLAHLAEGLVRLGLFLGYLWLIGRMRDIQRVFAYHGAEHMAIHAYEHGQPLTPEAVARFPTAHPRCGTAFLLVVGVISILVFVFLGDLPVWQGLLARLGFVPLIASLSYEVIRWGGRHAHRPLVRWVLAPSLALQALTTRPPDREQIDVALTALRLALQTDGVAPQPEGERAILHPASNAQSQHTQGREHGPGV